jgi:hypothetical protein
MLHKISFGPKLLAYCDDDHIFSPSLAAKEPPQRVPMPIFIQQPPLQLNLSKVSRRDGNGTG